MNHGKSADVNETTETPDHRSDDATTRRVRPSPNVGRLLLASWEMFAEGIVSGIRSGGFPAFRLADTQVLRNLEPEGTRITVLAERARMSKQAMSELVRRVERQGYVERRDDPEDGRAKRVHMTDDGLRVIEAAQATYRELIEGWRGELGEEDFGRLQDLLTELLDAHDALPHFHDPLDW